MLINLLRKFLPLIFFLISRSFFGQVNDSESGNITGKVIDEKTNYPIEYANIVLFNKKDSSLVTGTITDNKGKFVLEQISYGKYFLECNFLGYKKTTIDKININANIPKKDFKAVILKLLVENLNEVSIEAERPRIEFKIDKQVINVDKNLSSVGGTAVDVLKNSPSIKTDLEGNVYLRGSGSFTLLIDGKPTVMNPSNELKLIQASTIDKIEIITNPSAKYSPDGVTGIINIITKKETKIGVRGSINASVGTYNKYSLDAKLSYKTKKIRIISNIGYINKHYYDTESDDRTTFLADTTHIKTNYYDDHQVFNTKLKLGADYLVNKKTTFGFFVRYDKRGRTVKDISNSSQYPNNYYTNNYNEEYSGNYYAANFNFEREFDKKNEKITANSNFNFFNFKIKNNLIVDTTNSDFETIGLFPDKTKKSDDNDYFRNDTRIDYTKPIGNKGLLETGYSYRFVEDNSLNEYELFNYNLNSWINFSTDTSNLFIYSKSIHSLYGTYSNAFKSLEYKIGLRIEHYTRITNQKSINEKYIFNQFDYFPTLHLQYKISKKQILQTSYSRRIHRFWGTQLNPFPIILNANNISKGNPKLQPEYIDSYEFNHLYYFKSSYFSTKLYYRQTNNLVGKIQILQNDGILLHTYENLNKDYTTGLELMLNLTLYKWWLINTSYNYYHYQIKGTINNDAVNKETNSYDIRLENTFNLKYSTKIQITGYYSGPTISTQENIDDYYIIGMAIKKEFLKKKLNLTLRMDDIFNTGFYSSKREGNNYIIYYKDYPKYPLLFLQITYKI